MNAQWEESLRKKANDVRGRDSREKSERRDKYAVRYQNKLGNGKKT